jgi:DNA-binding PadR family transcriptional regulator
MVVLGLACEEPMHPYRMQALIKQRGKDKVANVAARNSVYQTIDALLRAGLIAVRETSRDERRSERTIYEATADGCAALRAWVRGGLATPAREFPEFPAVLSILMGVTGPDDLRALLEARVAPLAERLADLEKPVPGVPRVFLLEEEYMAAMVRAEIAWLRAIVADLKSGKLRFPTEEELNRLRGTPGGPSDEAVRRMAEELGTSSESKGGTKSGTKSGTKKRESERRGPTRGRRG